MGVMSFQKIFGLYGLKRGEYLGWRDGRRKVKIGLKFWRIRNLFDAEVESLQLVFKPQKVLAHSQP